MKWKFEGRYLYYLSGLLFCAGAAMSGEAAFLPIGVCFMVLGLPWKKRSSDKRDEQEMK